MRAAIRKRLVATFRHGFEKAYPPFSPIKLKRGSPSVWAWEITPALTFFVSVDPFDGEDRFVIEVAWSDDGAFPWSSIAEPLDFAAPQWRDRLSMLWIHQGKEHVWDLAPEEGIAREARWEARRDGGRVEFPDPPAVDVVVSRIDAAVADCLQKFQEYGVPLFEKVAENRGLKLSWDKS